MALRLAVLRNTLKLIISKKQPCLNIQSRKNAFYSSKQMWLWETNHCVNLSTAFTVTYVTNNQRLLRYAEALAINQRHPQLCKQREWIITLALPCFFYRDQVKPDEKTEAMADRLMTLVWTWIFYHAINNGHILFGEDVFPDPNTFTDAELGIE